MLPVLATLNKLYIRIWLAVVLAVAVLTLLVGWAWRMAADPPLREVVVRNEAGEVIGNGLARVRASLETDEQHASWAPAPGVPTASAPAPLKNSRRHMRSLRFALYCEILTRRRARRRIVVSGRTGL